MKNLKKFLTHAEYEAFKASDSYVTPNVSWCLDNNEVHFEPFVDPFNGHQYVDLGLQSGTLWAKCNVGAATETDYGLYFAWGETQGYTASQVGTDKNFSWSDYKFNPTGDGTTFTKYNATDGLTALELSDDAAHVNMGGIWVMPTDTQISELITLSHSVVTKNSVVGMEFTGTNGSTLFVPFAGSCDSGSVYDVGGSGSLWSSSLSSEGVDSAFSLFVDGKGRARLGSGIRYFGFSVRGVCQNSPQQ